MTIIDTNHPLYRPLWVRLLIVAVCAAWCAVEFYNHEPFWGTIVGGIAVYAAYVLLLTYKPPVDAATPASDKSAPEA
jgi:hypothetical protein